MAIAAASLKKELKDKLEKLAKETNRSQSYYIRLALDRFIRDRENYILAVSKLEQKNLHISHRKVRKELGLEELD